MSLDHIAHVRRESERFRECLAVADPAARVPSCPEWTAADLLWHLAEVQLFWSVIVRDRLSSPERSEASKPERPEKHADLIALHERAAQDLVDALESTPHETAVWTWADNKTAGFVRRRQAHEALVHRRDAELTVGDVTPFDAALAADGVDEVLSTMFGGHPDWATYTAGGRSGELRCDDTADRWVVQLGSWSGVSPNSGTEYTDEPGLTVRRIPIDALVPDVEFAITGVASDLDAWLWNRPPIGTVTTIGSTDALAEFRTILGAGVQ